MSKSTGEEVIDDTEVEMVDKETDWTLIVIIICSVIVTVVGIALFSGFLIKEYQ